jgi:hypothetical protein
VCFVDVQDRRWASHGACSTERRCMTPLLEWSTIAKLRPARWSTPAASPPRRPRPRPRPLVARASSCEGVVASSMRRTKDRVATMAKLFLRAIHTGVSRLSRRCNLADYSSRFTVPSAMLAPLLLENGVYSQQHLFQLF